MKEFLAQNFPEVVFENTNAKVITDVKEEYLSLRHGVGIRDISDSTFIIMRGIDSLDYLDRITTNSIKELPVLHKVSTLFTNDKGRIIDNAAIVRITDYFFVIGGQGSSSRLKSWIERYIINENIIVEDMTGKYAIFEVLGPQAESYMNLVFGETLESLSEELVIIAEINELKIYIAKFKGYNGTPKYWIFGDYVHASIFAQFLFEQKSFFDFNFIGEEAFNNFRVELAVPIYPNEFKDMFSPYDLKIMELVNLSKVRFLGQEIISRAVTLKKFNREFTGVNFENKCDVELPAILFNEHNLESGTLTSMAYSHSLAKQIGLVVVNRKASPEGKQFTVIDKENNRQNIILTSIPFRK